MTQFYLKNLALAIAITAVVSANGQPFHLVKDINTSTDGNPTNFLHPPSVLGTDNPPYAVFSGVAYFAADDGVHGIQLWRSDGTAMGTRLLKIVAPGSFTAQISNITPYPKGIIFAVTYNSINELWVSDGSDSGTQKITGLPIGYGYPPSQFTLVNNNIYFVNTYNLNNDQLWRTDGTDTGTALVADCYTSSYDYGYGLENLKMFKGMLYFSLTNNNGTGLWKSDGSAAGTSSIFNFGEGGQISTMTVLNDMLYLNGNYGGVSSLWQSDGTNIGTSIVPGSENTEVFDYEPQFPVVKNILYFSVQNGTLYKYNPKDSSGIVYVTQVNPDVASPGIQNLFSLNDSLFFFTAYDNLFNQQLWCSDGTALGTVLLKSTTRAYNSLFLNFYAIKKILYFSCYASGTGYELYTTDGSVSGTKMVKDINPGIYSSYPSFFTQTDSALIFNATDGVTGNELWRTDGTANGTALLKDINQATTASSSPALVYPGIEYLPLNNGQLFFGAFNDLYGDELWKTDGTPDGTFLTKDIIPGLFSGFDGVFSGLFTSYKDNYYYFGETLNDSVPLLKTDGTSAGTTLVQNFVGSTQLVGGSIPPWPSYMAATDSLLYIGFVDNELFAQLWVSDGQSTAKLINQNITYVSPGSGSLYALGVMVFFINGDNNNGIELWKSDGTYDGTKLVKDINPGPGNSYPTNMLVYNNKLYFTAFDGSNNYLWASDGTEAGTLVIEQVQISTSTPFTISGGKLYFTANTDTTGTELWVTDGTKAGTYQVKDVNPGTNSSNISNMVDVNGTLFFTADDGVHGNEIWKTDGTDSGTVLVKDITPGIGSTYPDYMVNYNGRLYCIINDTIWQSNGSAAGTLPVTDVSLNGLSNIQGLAVSGNNLYFSAYTYQYGNELYVGQINSTLPVTLLSFTGQWDKKDAVVNWQTTNEINNKYFNVQRSLTGSGFTNVGQIKADASLSQTHDYSFTDVNAASLGSNSVFYRLQQVDFDGHFTYSNIVRLPITGNGLITITPNPAQKTAYITSSADIAGATIIITDMGGRVISILKQNLSAASPAAINISGLASGVYNITVQGNNQVKLQSKLVVQ